MNTDAMFSSLSDEWETPQALFDELNQKFDFQLDVCASTKNNKCPVFYSKHDNGLAKPWMNRNWMNPPYGREIVNWVKKANTEAEGGCLQ